MADPSGRIPQRDFVKEWQAIKDQSSPFTSSDPKSFEYWFNYFWEESRQAFDLTEVNRARLCIIFKMVAEKKGPKFEVSSTYKTLMTVDNKLEVLTWMLKIGFKKIPLTGSVPQGKQQGQTVQGLDQAVEAKILFAQDANLLKAPNEVLHLGFRGDTRSYEQLVPSGGFTARARAWKQDVFSRFGFDQPWNPFSLPENQGCLFLRKGKSKDNCIHTVVSIASKLEDIMPYPMLHDTSLFELGRTPFDQWPPGDTIVRGNFTVKVIRKIGGVIEYVTNDIKVFVVSVDASKAFDTEGWQGGLEDENQKKLVANPFPERAVDVIPTENILAEVTIERHYFFAGDELQLFDVVFKNMRILPDEKTVDQRFGDGTAAAILSKIRSLEGKCKHLYASAKQLFLKPKPQGLQPVTSTTSCPYCGQNVVPARLEAHKKWCDKRPK